MSKSNQHVVPSGDGQWNVRRGGADRATKTFSTQKQAEKFARRIAKRNDGELFIHKRDGTIRERESYGNDPCPPRDRK